MAKSKIPDSVSDSNQADGVADTVPETFADVLAAKDFDPLEKYAHVYTGVNPDQMVTIDQAKAFLPYFATLHEGRSTFPLEVPAIVAMQSGMQTTVANAIPVETLLADGFPTDKKVFLFFQFGVPEEGKYEGSSRMSNAAFAIRTYFNGNPDGLWNDVKPR